MAGNDSFNVISGVVVEKRSFTWRIENFDLVRKSPAFISAQKFDFNIGVTIGQPTSFSFRLLSSVKDEVKGIGAYFMLQKPETPTQEVNAAFHIKIKHPVAVEEGYYFNGKVPFKNMAEKPGENRSPGWGFANVIKQDAKLEDLPLVNGSLIIEVDFQLYAAKPAAGDLATILAGFERRSLKQLSSDLEQSLVNVTCTNADGVTKIYSKDNLEFPVNRGILSARSAVFQRMFETRMSEAETGEVRIDDLSGKTLEVLLHYIYAGTLHQTWKSAEVIEELTSAAHRYELGLLTEFLDVVLGSVCDIGNAKRLLILAKKLGMKKAEVELFAFIKSKAVTVADVTVLVETCPFD